MKTLNKIFLQKQNPYHLEPVNRPRLDLLEKDEVKAKRPSMWNIVFIMTITHRWILSNSS
jgi:hypothetical protein